MYLRWCYEACADGRGHAYGLYAGHKQVMTDRRSACGAPHLDLSAWDIPEQSPSYSAIPSYAGPGVSPGGWVSRKLCGHDLFFQIRAARRHLERPARDKGPRQHRHNSPCTPRVHRELWPPLATLPSAGHSGETANADMKGRLEVANRPSTAEASYGGPLPRPTWRCGTMHLPAAG